MEPTQAAQPTEGGILSGGQPGQPKQANAPASQDLNSAYAKLRDQHNGLIGNFKSLQLAYAQAEAKSRQEAERAAKIESQLQRRQEDEARRARELSKQEIRKRLENGDPEELQRELLKVLDETEVAEKQAAVIQQKVAPQIYNEAYEAAQRAVHGKYEQGAFKVAELNGFSRADVVQWAAESGGDFDAFWAKVADQLADKKAKARTGAMDELVKKVSALESQLNAARRAQEVSPDTSQGQVNARASNFRSRAEIDAAYVNGMFGSASNKYGGTARKKYADALAKLGYTP